MNAPEKECREAFEKWCSDEGYDLSKPEMYEPKYLNGLEEGFTAAWQASKSVKAEPAAWMVTCVATNGRVYLFTEFSQAQEFVTQSSEGDGGLITPLYNSSPQPTAEKNKAALDALGRIHSSSLGRHFYDGVTEDFYTVFAALTTQSVPQEK